MDIYEAVLDHGIERPQEFESYLRRAGKLGKPSHIPSYSGPLVLRALPRVVNSSTSQCGIPIKERVVEVKEDGLKRYR